MNGGLLDDPCILECLLDCNVLKGSKLFSGQKALKICKELALAHPLTPPAAIRTLQKCSEFERAEQVPLMNWAVRSLASYPPDVLLFYVPQLIQGLHGDPGGLVQELILALSRESPFLAHQLIWNARANEFTDDNGAVPSPLRKTLLNLISKIEHSCFGEDRSQGDFYSKEFRFFSAVTAISGTLRPQTRTMDRMQKKALIDEELGKIHVEPGVYLPSNPEAIVVDIDRSSGRPLQSAAKVIPSKKISDNVFHVCLFLCLDRPLSWLLSGSAKMPIIQMQ